MKIRDKTKQNKKQSFGGAEGLDGLHVCLFIAVVELKRIVVGLLILSYIKKKNLETSTHDSMHYEKKNATA